MSEKRPKTCEASEKVSHFHDFEAKTWPGKEILSLKHGLNAVHLEVLASS